MKAISLNRLSELLMLGFVKLCVLWVISALCFQIFNFYLEFSGQKQRQRDMINKIEWKFDGRFKNNPDNIWYETPKK
jgi:hypothetical protein